VYAINAGSTSAVTLDGVRFEADRFSSSGAPNTTADPISGASSPALYQSERYGTFTYSIPVTQATYSVVLHFVELYHQAAGNRSFSVTVEGQPLVTGLDIYKEVGHDTAYVLRASNIPVNDGALTIQFTTQVDNATVSGIAIYSADGGRFEEPPIPPICPDSGPCKILPLGDSITDGIGSNGGGYRVELFRQAVLNNKNITFVGSKANGPTTVEGKSFPRNHEGYSGYSINQLAGVVPNPALNGDPNIILLMIGTNDSWVEENNNGPQVMAQRLGALIDKIINAKPNALLAVAVITPRHDYARQWADSYVAVIPGVVQERINQGFNVILVDQYKGFPSNGLGGDNLHPNDTGYRFIGQTWYNAIKDYLK
jgi:lysophospholipase L1-like esterase